MRDDWEVRRRQFMVLYRVFLTRVVDLELLANDADTSRLVGQFVTIFAGISFLFTAPALLLGVPMRGGSVSALWTTEHFFLATTMLVAGGVSVMTWDSAFPDRRDVLVLAPLPVRMSTLFAAKIAAMLAGPLLAVVALNVFSGILWPMLFSSHSGGTLHAMRAWPAYWATMLTAGAFLFCSLLTMQGMVANVLPRQVFLRLSAVLQAVILGGLLCVYVLEPTLESAKALVSPENQRVLAWLPTYWFLGLFQQLNGSMQPEFVGLAHRAWVGLAVSFAGAAGAVLLSYFRMLPKIVEQPEIVPGRLGWVGRWVGRVGTSGGLGWAMTRFSLRTLLRSRQHRMILSFYLGIGLAIVVAYGRASREAVEGTIPVSSLLTSVLMMLLSVLALRVVVSVPISLRANWVMRMTQVRAARAYRGGVRWSWMALTVGPVVGVVASYFLAAYRWRPVLMHLALLGAVGVLVVEICLATFRKIPFACSYLPGKANIHFVFWATLLVFLWLLKEAVTFESGLLVRPWRFWLLFAGVGMVACAVRVVTELRSRGEEELVFDEEYGVEIVTLGLR